MGLFKEMLRKEGQLTLRCGDNVLDLTHPRVMGIINATPDSFYAPSRTLDSRETAVLLAQQMIGEGADILDIGGLSTRPGAEEIPVAEELARVIPVVGAIHRALPEAIISVDTYRAVVAEKAIEAGATIVNDISGGQMDQQMAGVIAHAQVPYVLMHLRGTPADMQSHTDYQDLIGDISRYFVDKIRALDKAGVRDVILDPGFGFAKTMQQNYELIRKLDVFSFLGRPLMIGVSRKSTLSKTIGRPVEETLQATTALHMAALMKGASILRVHDVQAARDAILVYRQWMEPQMPG